jgi:hypothetical protein
MADPYRITDSVEQHTTTQPPRTRGTGLRRTLWVGLFVSAAANASASSLGANPLIGIGFGLATLACIAALIVHHYRSGSR